MMKSEFDALMGCETPADDYKKIEFVYNWHPCNLSKEAAASLYKEFGIGIFEDMFSAADDAKHLEEEIGRADAHLRVLREELNKLNEKYRPHRNIS
ncbi:MAG: hypothetical protein J6S67_13115 [Methanobrevibacter sp.]|nr:hypothetical protein [Methanobrevibacter sp.]